jgi:hypothetical protein
LQTYFICVYYLCCREQDEERGRGIERLREGEDVKRKGKALKGGKRNRNRRRDRKRVLSAPCYQATV